MRESWEKRKEKIPKFAYLDFPHSVVPEYSGIILHEMFVTVSVIVMALLAVLLCVLVVSGAAALAGASFRKFFMRGLWALLVPPAVFIYGMAVERNLCRVSDVVVRDSRVPEQFDGYRIVQISDLHLDSFRGRERFLASVVEKIDSLRPDLILFTGDLVTSHPDEILGLEPVLSSLKAPDGVYSVLGNHDYCIYRHWDADSLRTAAVRTLVERETALGWKVLMNGCVNISRDASASGDSTAVISVAGVENISRTSYFPSYGDLDKAMAGVRGSFRILMTHDPTHWHKAVSEYPDIALVLSGHTHAMQLSILGWSPSRCLYKEYRGLYRKRVTLCGGAEADALLYVNIGLGETALPSRVGAPPEITLFTLRHSPAENPVI